MDFTIHIPHGQPVPHFVPDSMYRLTVVDDDKELHIRFNIDWEHVKDFTDVVRDFLTEQATPYDYPTICAIARSLTQLGVANANQKTLAHAMALYNIQLMDQETEKTPFDKGLVVSWFDQLSEYFSSRRESTDGNTVKH